MVWPNCLLDGFEAISHAIRAKLAQPDFSQCCIRRRVSDCPTWGDDDDDDDDDATTRLMIQAFTNKKCDDEKCEKDSLRPTKIRETSRNFDERPRNTS